MLILILLFLVFLAADRLDLNITSSLIMMIMNTHKNWSEDYYGPSDSGPQQDSQITAIDLPPTEVTAGHFRKRAPFVPFLIRNETGKHVKQLLNEVKYGIKGRLQPLPRMSKNLNKCGQYYALQLIK